MLHEKYKLIDDFLEKQSHLFLNESMGSYRKFSNIKKFKFFLRRRFQNNSN